LHWIVPRPSFVLLSGAEDLREYRFGTGIAKHLFCGYCGIQSHYVPRSDPDKVDVNVRCLEGVDLQALRIAAFDGRNWETAIEGPLPWRT